MKLYHHWNLSLFTSVLHLHLVKLAIILFTEFSVEQCPPFFCILLSLENNAHFLLMLLELDVSLVHNLSSTIVAITVSLAPEMNC